MSFFGKVPALLFIIGIYVIAGRLSTQRLIAFKTTQLSLLMQETSRLENN